jgi:hypothetical protein
LPYHQSGSGKIALICYNQHIKSDSVKLVIFVPETHTDIVREAMGKAGAGKIGKYSFCTFSYPVGHGRMNQPLAIKRIKAILG